MPAELSGLRNGCSWLVANHHVSNAVKKSFKSLGIAVLLAFRSILKIYTNNQINSNLQQTLPGKYILEDKENVDKASVWPKDKSNNNEEGAIKRNGRVQTNNQRRVVKMQKARLASEASLIESLISGSMHCLLTEVHSIL